MQAVHLLIEAIYILCPAVVLGRAIYVRFRRRQPRVLPLRRFRQASLAGIAAGVLIAVTFALSVHGKLMMSQIMLAGYFATSMILILQMMDRWSWHLCKSALRLQHPQLPSASYNFRAISALVIRAGLVFCIGLPYVLATMMTYRPRAGSLDTPLTLFQWNYEAVTFAAFDGTRIAGWWIPGAHGESSSTVLLCPGTSKAAQLSLVKRLHTAGYNVLAIDFRGNGDSGGQLCSFGDLERQDVLGAMRWLRIVHPRGAQRVSGIGVSTGAAALVAAAADPSPEGQNIDALALYGSYDRLDHEVNVLVDQFVPMPLAWFVEHVGLPLAGLQVGADLKSFAPAEQIKTIWPRPVLIIHAMDDEFIPFEQGEKLYESAFQPKDCFWIKNCDHGHAIKNTDAARMVIDWFDNARRVL